MTHDHTSERHARSSTPPVQGAPLVLAPKADARGLDVLSDVLRQVRLTGAVFFDVEATTPWVAEAPPASSLAPFVMPGAQHVLEFHAVTAGRCFGGLLGEPAAELHAGDVIMFPQGDAHVMSSAPGLRGRNNPDLFQPGARFPIAIHEGPSGPRDAHVICGFISCDLRPFNPLIAALPRVLVTSTRTRGSSIELFMACAAAEARDARPGRGSMLTKLSELMFVEMVRNHFESLPEGRAGWLSGLRDAHVGRALAEMHERPADNFDLEELARVAGLSRSAFAERFSALVGLAPMQYLAQWRMQLASGLLNQGQLSLAQVASEVGYESEAAFSRAFKKIVGTSPGQWRRIAR